MSDYLLVSHSLRYNFNNDFKESHFTLQDGFNLITLHKPGRKLHSKLGYIIEKYLPKFKNKIISSFSEDKINRRKILNYIEDRIILEHISYEFQKRKEEDLSDEESSEDGLSDEKSSEDELSVDELSEEKFSTDKLVGDESSDEESPVDESSSDEESSVDESSDEEFINLMNGVLIEYNLNVPDYFKENLYKIKDFLNFEIRVYLEGEPAPKMLIQFIGGTGSFMGLFDIDSLPEHLFNKMNDFFETRLLGYSIIEFSENYILRELLDFLLDNGIKGNIFMFNCGTYDVPTPKSSFLRQKSNTEQGYLKKYLKYKKKYLELKNKIEL